MLNVNTVLIFVILTFLLCLKIMTNNIILFIEFIVICKNTFFKNNLTLILKLIHTQKS